MKLKALPQNKKILLFDGVCNLCNTTVQFIIKRDKKDVFRFVAIQSEVGQKIINSLEISTVSIDSIILYESENVIHYKAPAALRVLIALGGIYKLAGIFTILPKWLTNRVYDFIARNRYRWYGKQESCILPSSEINHKFLI